MQFEKKDFAVINIESENTGNEAIETILDKVMRQGDRFVIICNVFR